MKACGMKCVIALVRDSRDPGGLLVNARHRRHICIGELAAGCPARPGATGAAECSMAVPFATGATSRGIGVPELDRTQKPVEDMDEQYDQTSLSHVDGACVTCSA